MKIQSIKLRHFKRFKELERDFTDPETGLAKDLIVLIGRNGSGKTSILQAIAATLGMATGRLNLPSELKWPGFNYDLLGNHFEASEPIVNLHVQFSKTEHEATEEFFYKIHGRPSNKTHGMTRRKSTLAELPRTPPSKTSVVSLDWNGLWVSADSNAELLQFKGREYAKKLSRLEGYQTIERVGTVFWYTEQRTLTSLTTEDINNQIEITDDILRDRLSKWRQIHTMSADNNPSYKDLYAEIEQTYQAVFPERRFVGPVLRDSVDAILEEPWFYLSDGERNYEISEMSGGERAIFPILMDFANWNIHNSVILIDELELHLHPPMQQALLRALPKLGKNNQFIITTHSDYVEQMVPEACIVRLED